MKRFAYIQRIDKGLVGQTSTKNQRKSVIINYTAKICRQTFLPRKYHFKRLTSNNHIQTSAPHFVNEMK